MATYENVSAWQKFKNTMKNLTWKERIAHLWEYYKWFAVAAVVLIAMTISVVSSVTENSKELLYGGACINLGITDEGKAYLTEGWFEKLEGQEKKARVDLTPMSLNMGANATTDLEMANREKIIAMVTTGDLDYLLLDATSLTFCGNNGIITPLENFLSKEMLAKFEGKLVTIQSEEGAYAGAIDISDLPFVKKHMGTDDKVYIAFPGNTERTERNEAFLQYILDWTE